MDAKQGADNTLVYILAQKGKEAGAAAFNTFRTDPDWVAAKDTSEKKADGSLTEGGQVGVKSVYMNPSDYSPAK